MSNKSLEDDKTDFAIRIGGCIVQSADKARNLGVVFDRKMIMESQVDQICR